MKKFIIDLLMLLCIAVFVGAGSHLVKYYLDARNAQADLDDLQRLKQQGSNLMDTKESDIMNDYRLLYKKNHDIIGWIRIDGTKIDYPVMQTPDEEDYYLYRNFEKQYDKNGLPFLSVNCDLEDIYANLMIYGHHMKSGMMFAELLDYDKESFYQSHRIIYFDTLSEARQYEIIGVFYSRIFQSSEMKFKFYDYIGNLEKSKFEKFIKNVKKHSIYNTGVEAVYGEQLMTLVTCSYHVNDGRFIVVAKRKIGTYEGKSNGDASP